MGLGLGRWPRAPSSPRDSEACSACAEGSSRPRLRRGAGALLPELPPSSVRVGSPRRRRNSWMAWLGLGLGLGFGFGFGFGFGIGFGFGFGFGLGIGPG